MPEFHVSAVRLLTWAAVLLPEIADTGVSRMVGLPVFDRLARKGLFWVRSMWLFEGALIAGPAEVLLDPGPLQGQRGLNLGETEDHFSDFSLSRLLCGMRLYLLGFWAPILLPFSPTCIYFCPRGHSTA